MDDSLHDNVHVDCEAGELAVAVGGYCGGHDLEVMNLPAGLESVYVRCSDNNVFGYAICCDANLD